GFSAAINEEARDLWMLSNQILRRSGFMIDVFGVDFCAMIEKQFRDFNVARKMKRMLAISTARSDKRWIVSKEGTKLLHPTEPRRLMNANLGPTTLRVLG